MINIDLVILLLAAISLLAGLAAGPVRLTRSFSCWGVCSSACSGAFPPHTAGAGPRPGALPAAADPLLGVLSSIEELRANAGPILWLAVGLVLATVGGVAAVAALVVGLPWAVAFALGSSCASPTSGCS
jgi:CPA1 family monovalent cation:H+ antiporter